MIFVNDENKEKRGPFLKQLKFQFLGSNLDLNVCRRRKFRPQCLSFNFLSSYLSAVSMHQKTFLSTDSVTRFGEISPLWQKFSSAWLIFDGLSLICQNSKPTLANLFHYFGLIFIAANGPILKYNLTIWSHCQKTNTLNMHFESGN